MVVLGVVYKIYNPSHHSFFPKCPLYALTNIKCPGCGSQRGIHHLLNFDIAHAAQENFLLVLFLPYIVLGLWIEYVADKSKVYVLKIRKQLYGLYATYIVLVIVLLFWALRIAFHF